MTETKPRADASPGVSPSVRSRGWSAFRGNIAAVVSVGVIAMFVFVALFGPSLAPFSPTEQDLSNNYASPSLTHPLGTDDLGRDTLSRLIHGARISLAISFTSVFLGVVLGSGLGWIAAFYGGWIDSVIVRVMDVLLALPGILLAIAIVVVLGSGVGNTIWAVAIFSVPTFARLVRGSAMSVIERDFVAASQAMGASDTRIIVRHLVPNTLTPLIVQSTLQLGEAILVASALSFLGLGVQPPNPEWGAMLSKGRELVRTIPIAAVAPGLSITAVVLSFSLLGDGLRDALDPRTRG